MPGSRRGLDLTRRWLVCLGRSRCYLYETAFEGLAPDRICARDFTAAARYEIAASMQRPCPLIVALDLPSRADALELATRLRNHVGMVKVGLEPFVAHGPGLVLALRDLGLDVFLDLKIHDIPRTAAAAVREAASLGVRMVTVHALGGTSMVAAAVEAAEGMTSIVAVTLLTSMDQAQATEIGLKGELEQAVFRLGKAALVGGADGLVCSAHELACLQSLGGVRVVPGIRPAGAAAGDQRRVATPAQAMRGGATWIVVGRPIVEASDPQAAAKAICAELAAEEP